jgi:uncharacterized protein YecT (DUF1311 family)
MDWVKDLVLAILSWIASTSSNFINRKVEKKPIFENIEKAQKLLCLQKELDQTKYTLEDLKHLEDALMGEADADRKLGSNYERRSDIIKRIELDTATTQTEMNIVAGQAYERAERRLESTIKELKEHFSDSDEGIKEIDVMNKAWEVYRKEHAEFVAKPYKGGTIYPLIYASALESVTITRITELETLLKQLREM